MAPSFIGHPFASIGVGEQLRSHIRAARAVGLTPAIHDVLRFAPRTDPVHRATVGTAEVERVPAGTRIWHVNADEAETAIAAFEARGNVFSGDRNVIVPAWELPRFPPAWRSVLRRFDAVWALSGFIRDALAAIGVAAPLVGQAADLPPGPTLPRRHFGISESAFVLLHALDLSSYAARKNPAAVLDLFARLRGENPFRDIQLVLKVKDGEGDAAAWAADLAGDPALRVIDAPLDSIATSSLLSACDVFVSLHRAEGFGRGLAEAMRLGRVAMATGWSGNTDFMTGDNSLLVRHRLVRVRRGEYPHAAGQSWAEPDLDHALALLRPLLGDPERGRALARRGQADVLRTHGERAVGLRILAALR